MIIKASGRSALILAAGLFVCCAGPSLAATDADDSTANSTSENAAAAPVALHKNLRHGAHHRKKLRAPQIPQDRVEACRRQQSRRDRCRCREQCALVGASALGRQCQRAAGLPRHAGRYRRGDGGASRAIFCKPRPTIRLTPKPTIGPWSSPRTSSTMSIARLHEGNAPAADAVVASADPPAAPVATSQRKLHLGRDLPDRENLHRLWRTADDGLGRAHVHGVRYRRHPG